MFVAAALLIRLGLAATATSLAPAPSRVACQVELQPGDAPRAWIVAAAAVRDSLRGRADADRDCRAVVIHANGERPSVEVVTLDGRHGIRRLADAGDVAATVAALIVTIQEEAAASNQGASMSTLVAQPAAPTAEPTGWRPQIVISGGTRFSPPHTQSVLLELGFGLVRPSWELGVFGALAPATVAIGSGSPSFSSSAEAAVGGAWRPALGASNVELVLGGRAGIVRFGQAENQGIMKGGDLGGVAPTITAFVGAVFVSHSIVRLRPQLWYQWSAATRLGGDASSDAPPLSSVGLSLGVESRLP